MAGTWRERGGATREAMGASLGRALDLSIGQRLGLGFALVLLAVGALVWTTAARLSAVNAIRRAQLQDLTPRAIAADAIENQVLDAELAAQSFALTHDERPRVRFEESTAEISRGIATLRRMETDPGATRQLAEIAGQADALFAAMRPMLASTRDPWGPDLLERATGPASAALLRSLRAYHDKQRRALEQAQGHVDAAIRNVFAGCILFGLGALAVVGLTGLWTSRRVRDPVRRLLAAMRTATADGDSEGRRLDLAAPGRREPRDELALLSGEFARMAGALRDRELRFRTLADNAPDIIARYDRQLRHVFVNAAATRVTGLAPDRFLGKTNRELGMADTFVDAWEPRLRSVFETGQPLTFEFPFQSRDRTSHLEAMVVPERGASGAIESVLSFARDVTDRVHAQAERAAAEERYRSLFTNMTEGFALGEALVDRGEAGGDFRFLEMNDAFERQSGLSREVAVGRPIREVLPNLEQSWIDIYCGVALGTAPPQRFEMFNRDLGRHFSVYCFSPSPGRFAILFTDITKRKVAENALRASEARLRRMIDINPIGVLTGDDTGHVTYANDAYLRIVGRSRLELERGHVRWDVITPPEHLAADARAVAQAKERGASDVYQKEYLRPDGTRVPVLVACATMDGSRELTAFVVDISDRRMMEDELRESQERLRIVNDRLLEADRRKDEFLGMLSHELRNPLAPIRNALFILDHAEPMGLQARRAKEIALRQVGHLTRLVDDLLDVTRIARGKIELRRHDLDLAALARRTTDDHRAVFQDRGVGLELVVPAEPVLVDGDETRLAQVLGNLLHNASKFTPAGGHVTVTVAQRAGEAVVAVSDTGVGMDAETLKTIFEPFVQAKQTIARSEGGLGLGLALVKGLVAMHGGEVTARSEGPGRGTEFVVALPLDRRHHVRAHPQGVGGARSAAARRRILVVDDNQDAAETLAQLLEMDGHEVVVAHDGPGAVASALAHPPDIVLCDIGLPGMDGYEVARRLRAGAPGNIRLVAVSGYAQPEDIARATEAGFDAHVAKPPDPERLGHLLH